MTQTAAQIDREQTTARSFLPEIQALRTIAVMIVVLYHVWPTHVPGGFVGVDVFFAISGFLITAHLLRELVSTGRVRVLRFWSRRVRRLLPAAFTVLAASAIFTLTVLPELVRIEVLRQIAASAAYVENWVLANDSVDYLASANDPTIVQHYWSLSVEEQFYLLWPLVLLAATSVVAAAARRSRRAVVTATGVATSAVIVGSLAFSIFLTWFSPSVAYFHTATRAWEFALGALVAVVIAARPDLVEWIRRTWFVRSGALTLLGLAAIGASVIVITGASPFPGYIALLPVLGAVAIMLAGMPRWRPLAAVVAWRPVQYTGDISYSIYLWHWPLIIGFGVVVGTPPSGAWGVAVVAASFVLAGLTKVLIEDPGRRARLLSKPLAAIAFALVGALVFVGLATGVTSIVLANVQARQQAIEEAVSNPTDCFGASATLSEAGCEDRFELTSDVDLTLAANDLDYQHWCLTWHDQDWASCEFGETADPKGTIALVGDSHAASMVQAFDEYFRAVGWRVVTMTRFGCSGLNYEIVGADYTTEPGRQEYDCRVWTQRVNDELTSRTDIDAVLYTNYTSSYTSPRRNEPYTLKVDDIEKTWTDVIDSGKKVIVLKDPPRTMGDNVPECLVGHVGETGPCSTARSESVLWDPQDDAAKLFDHGVTTIDMTHAFCDDERCYAVIGGVVVYADHNHVSGTFSRTMMPYLGPLILDATR